MECLLGSVYLVGCTNAGKSTLFNRLVSSDYCKSHVRELVHRATVSLWPGTTMGVLKFPIVTPTIWRLKQRSIRLADETGQMEADWLKKFHVKSTSKNTLCVNCPTDFTDLTTGCYFFQVADVKVKQLNWYQAEDACQAKRSDAHLVSIQSEEEWQLIKSNVPGSASIMNLWTGATYNLDQSNYGKWVGTNPLNGDYIETLLNMKFTAKWACARIKYKNGRYRFRTLPCKATRDIFMGYICEASDPCGHVYVAQKIDRVVPVFKPLVVPEKLQRDLPFQYTPKNLVQKKLGEPFKRVTVVRSKHESKVSKLMNMISELNKHKDLKRQEADRTRAMRNEKMREKIELGKAKKHKERKKEIFRALGKMEKRDEKSKKFKDH